MLGYGHLFTVDDVTDVVCLSKEGIGPFQLIHDSRDLCTGNLGFRLIAVDFQCENLCEVSKRSCALIYVRNEGPIMHCSGIAYNVLQTSLERAVLFRCNDNCQ